MNMTTALKSIDLKHIFDKKMDYGNTYIADDNLIELTN